MQAIILAAGMGSRLRPLTKEMPKALTEVNGQPIITNTLDILSEFKISNVTIVVGYLGDKIKEACGNAYKGMKIQYISNELYSSTNNNYSLYLAKDVVYEDILLIECDILFKKEILDKMMEYKSECSILVSPYNKETMDGTIIYTDSNDKAIELVLGKYQKSDDDFSKAYKTINIYKFSYEFWQNKFVPELENYINNYDKNSYYEQVLGALIYYRDSDIRIICEDENDWGEIDNVQDLLLAEKKFSVYK